MFPPLCYITSHTLDMACYKTHTHRSLLIFVPLGSIIQSNTNSTDGRIMASHNFSLASVCNCDGHRSAVLLCHNHNSHSPAVLSFFFLSFPCDSSYHVLWACKTRFGFPSETSHICFFHTMIPYACVHKSLTPICPFKSLSTHSFPASIYKKSGS